MNLAVTSTLKILKSVKVLSEIREIVKKLKTVRYKMYFKQKKIPRPKLDVATRWNSIYMMLESLKLIKSDLLQITKKMCKKDGKEVEISNEKWEFIEKFVEAFKPPFIATKSLQTV